MKTSKQSPREAEAIFDNGGGVTLILNGGEFAHHYSDPEDAARDYLIYMRDGTLDGWEGHEPEAAKLNPTQDEILNGGYRVFDPEDIGEATKAGYDDEGWNNVREFLAAVELPIFR